MVHLIRDINPSQAHMRDLVPLENGMVVERSSIYLSSLVEYIVWEPSASLGAHSTLTTIGGKWYGNVTTRPLPKEIEALPGWKPGYWPVERIAAAESFQAANAAEAEALIKATFPEDFADAASHPAQNTDR